MYISLQFNVYDFFNVGYFKWIGDFFASKSTAGYDTGVRNPRERGKSSIASEGEY